jgi:NAD(P)-dependent dehydrogenase (short-subunit alcohol dehydrogenase family)
MTGQLEVPEIRRDDRLRGRTAIVTGGGSDGELAGSGAAICVLLAAKGANVVIVDLDKGRADHTLAAIEAEGSEAGTASIFTADITDAAQGQAAVDFATATYGGVDVLVNNAAIAPGEQNATEQLWDRILDLNLKAAHLMMTAAIPAMRARGGGSIVNISSISAFRAGGGPAYSAAKGGMVALGKAVAYEQGPYGIRVNNVAPGHVALPMGLGYQGWDEDNQASQATRIRRARASMLGSEGNGWDIAYAVLFLASDESRYITAASLPVDGGAIEVFPIVMWPRLADLGEQ